MNMKRVIAAFTILISSALIIISCKKPTPNEEPKPDTEVQSAIDATFALMCITDIDMICSYIAENQFYSNSYLNVIAPGNGTYTANRDTFGIYLIASWYKTACVDGKFREGSVFLRYNIDKTLFPNQTDNSRYMREKGFAGKFTLTDYYVNGWKIENVAGIPAYVYNTLASPDYDPAVTKLTWYMGGKFKFTKTDNYPDIPDTTMTVEFKINKTLDNSTSKDVFNATKTNKNTNIQWSKGVVHYDGELVQSSTTTNGEHFTMTISKETPLVRDWSCSPDKFNGVVATATPGVFIPIAEQYHPFVKGVATFVTGDKYPRQIYYGNESDPSLPWQCDNTGIVLIKGNSYKVTFMK
jgi:hypothetical protein